MREAVKEKNNKKQVIVIPATKALKGYSEFCVTAKKIRVCGYARVSTDEEEQLSSCEAQKDYFRNYILKNDKWEYVNVYFDEGITGCNTKKRVGFNNMINDALNGKIDLIVTKSISRFARNTVDSLSTIRKLKEHNVEVYFERENIWTCDSKGELLLTILSSFAQEEARSISENSTWGQRKRFADGRYSVAYSNFLGYDKDFKINEKEAEVVKLIFNMFLSGKKYGEIKYELENRGIPSPRGKKKWYINVIKKILMNEKYCGDALLQKQYTCDFLTKTRKNNNGEIKQYYITDGHKAIISKEQFQLAQIEIKDREKKHKVNMDIFSGKLYCKECGDKYYRCKSYLRDKNGNHIKTYISYKCDSNGYGCPSKYIKIGIVKNKFVEELNSLDRTTLDEVIEYSISDMNLKDLKMNFLALDEKIRHIKSTDNSVLKKLIIKKLCESKENLEFEIKKCESRIKKLRELKKITINDFDEELFQSIIYKVYIDANRNVSIIFKGQNDTHEIHDIKLSRHLRKQKRK